MLFSEARERLLSQGWKPNIVHHEKDDYAPLDYYLVVKPYGYKELDSCSSSAFCVFHYKRKNQCLSVVTLGEKVETMIIRGWRYSCPDSRKARENNTKIRPGPFDDYESYVKAYQERGAIIQSFQEFIQVHKNYPKEKDLPKLVSGHKLIKRCMSLDEAKKALIKNGWVPYDIHQNANHKYTFTEKTISAMNNAKELDYCTQQLPYSCDFIYKKKDRCFTLSALILEHDVFDVIADRDGDDPDKKSYPCSEVPQ